MKVKPLFDKVVVESLEKEESIIAADLPRSEFIEKCTKKYVYQVNYPFAIHICRYFISKMAEKSPPDVEALISKEILPVRPERHVPRKVVHKKVVSFLYRVA